MRDAEADIAEALSNAGWLTVLDGPLHGIRHRRGLAIIGYVKTHHRRMLAGEHWVRVPDLTAGERSGLFAMEDALYGCYLRVGDRAGPGEPDADRGSRTAPASPPGRRAPRVARCARRCSNATAKYGRHDLDDDRTDRRTDPVGVRSTSGERTTVQRTPTPYLSAS